MHRSSFVLAVLALAACGGASTSPKPVGPLSFAIVAGQNQTATAGSDSLSKPVVGQLVMATSGRLVFRTIGDVRAQTVVNGSPVPGSVVCAVSPNDTHALKAFNPCTNTDSDGKATFWFTPPTAAGTATAEIHGTDANGNPAAFDTVTASVQPGSARVIKMKYYDVGGDSSGPTSGGVAVALGDSLDVVSWIGTVTDAYGNVITDYSSAQVAEAAYSTGASPAWTPGRFVTFPDTGWYRAWVKIDSTWNFVFAHVQ